MLQSKYFTTLSNVISCTSCAEATWIWITWLRTTLLRTYTNGRITFPNPRKIHHSSHSDAFQMHSNAMVSWSANHSWVTHLPKTHPKMSMRLHKGRLSLETKNLDEHPATVNQVNCEPKTTVGLCGAPRFGGKPLAIAIHPNPVARLGGHLTRGNTTNSIALWSLSLKEQTIFSSLEFVIHGHISSSRRKTDYKTVS